MFEAQIAGEFPDKSFPTDPNLSLRKGAQVMFVKNETGELKRYFNGKLAVVTTISEDKIVVELADSGIKMELEKDTWKNLRYNYNAEKGNIEEEELGTFTQYPVRLAWAITIHKSQGLTFERAIIDAGHAFAPGQVYVALSRCTTLEGVVLHSKVHPSAIKTDQQVLAFSALEADEDQLLSTFKSEQHIQGINLLHKYFDCNKLIEAAQYHHKMTKPRKHSEKVKSLQIATDILSHVHLLQDVSRKFAKQLSVMIIAFRQTGDVMPLKQRVESAVGYYAQVIESDILLILHEHKLQLEKNKKTAKYARELEVLDTIFKKKIALLNHTKDMISSLEKSTVETSNIS